MGGRCPQGVSVGGHAEWLSSGWSIRGAGLQWTVLWLGRLLATGLGQGSLEVCACTNSQSWAVELAEGPRARETGL